MRPLLAMRIVRLAPLGRAGQYRRRRPAGLRTSKSDRKAVNITRATAAWLGAALLLSAHPVLADAADPAPAISVHAGKADSLNHALAMQFAAAVATGNTALTLQVEESQGSVQNIIDATHRSGGFVFTTSPNLISQARRGDKPFPHNARYREIRALFPIPPLTMHWVVRTDSGITDFTDIAAHPFIPGGKGSFGERQTASALHVLGLDDRVPLIDIDAAGAQRAFVGKQVSGLAMAGTFPLPVIVELAHATPIRLLSLTPDELKRVLAGDDSIRPQIIPKGTYPGVDDDTVTVAQPVGVYTTTRMSEKLAYAITKSFWSQRAALAERNPAWTAVTPAALASLGMTLHQGALRYYREAGIKIPQAIR